MEEMTNSLDLLEWPIKVVNALRQLLLSVNIPLPAFMAQALVCIVLILITYYLRNKLRSAKSAPSRLAGYSVIAACIIGLVSVLSVWADCAIYPRNKQIIGQVVMSGSIIPSISLLDNINRDLGVGADIDSQGGFFIQFPPVFADPPAKIRMQQLGCKPHDYVIRRAHLLGDVILLQWNCDAL